MKTRMKMMTVMTQTMNTHQINLKKPHRRTIRNLFLTTHQASPNGPGYPAWTIQFYLWTKMLLCFRKRVIKISLILKLHNIKMQLTTRRYQNIKILDVFWSNKMALLNKSNKKTKFNPNRLKRPRVIKYNKLRPKLEETKKQPWARNRPTKLGATSYSI